MSIFKATFKDYIAKQIEARQNLLNSHGTRPLDVQKYVSAKSPWIKMTSFVDYGDPKKGITPNKDLAKQYVLMGGTLYPDPKDTTDTSFKLRSGILAKDSAYGTNLGSGTTNKVNLQYGIRPMPGITSVNIKSKSAYGSLREAVVKFYAWDVKQLEDLLILYMRPGYPVLLEWGNSIYIDNTNGKVKSFDTPTINCFQENLTQEAIYAALEKYRKKLSGNYDGMLGLIRNYETSMLPNGGFECTTTLISIGDVIDSIKMNSEKGSISEKTEYKDEFELFLRGYTQNMGAFSSEVATLISTYQSEASAISGIDTNIYAGKSKQNAQNVYTSTKTTIFSNPQQVGVSSFINANQIAATTPDTNSGSSNTGGSNVIDPAYPYYIQLAYFIFILSKQKNLYTKDGGLLDIEIPLPGISGNYGDGTCIASRYSMAIDIDACIIQNSQANILKTKIDGNDVIGYRPDVSSVNPNGDATMKEYLYGNTDLGIIGNIYVDLGKMIDLYKNESLNNKGNVYLGKYIKAILKEVEFSLGSINSFDIFTLENKLVIIDKHYTEDPANTKYGNKFQLNILGTDTIVKHQKIVSKIFPSQATIIAIAAQSRKNISSLQSSTYSQMNAGLKSRLFPVISESDDDLGEKSIKEENLYINNVKKLLAYVQDQLLPFNYGYQTETNKPAINTILNSFLVKIAKASDYKGIIPVSLEVTMDGIGGITIGEIFRINDDILPREYADKSVGFIVTGISQDITRPEWNTSLQTQFCLLDQDVLQKRARSEADKLITAIENKLKHDRNVVVNSFGIYNAFVGFFSDLYYHRFHIDISLTRDKNNMYYTGFKYNGISYKKNAGSVKDLEAALNTYHPTFDQGLISSQDFLKEMNVVVGLVLTDIYKSKLAAEGNNALSPKPMDAILTFVQEINMDKVGYPASVRDISPYAFINQIINGTADYKNKYLRYDEIKRYGMYPAVLSLLNTNYSTVTSRLTDDSYIGNIVFQQYLPEKSTDEIGNPTPNLGEIVNKILLKINLDDPHVVK